MPWNDGLTPEQQNAASSIGSHVRLLAGPGTGKTLVMSRHMRFLIEEQGIPASEIVALTFTRAAANELRERVASELPYQELPRVSTLHSFALRQLLRNARRLSTLPQPLRVADDWEERNIILEDLKTLLNLPQIDDARDLFLQLSADWETLAVDQGEYTPNPRFIGAWQQHRAIYGYTLRSELVYQLKRALEQLKDFLIDAPIRHLLVDEYQDLNRCDLAVIKSIADHGAEVYVAGDDDQSIYGFRKAHPQGIRNFPVEYTGSIDLPLHICKRCDSEILRTAEFVAELDPQRIPKGTQPEVGRPPGEVALLRFANEYEEASWVATLCQQLINNDHISPENILILLRVDTRGAFSRILKEKFDKRSLLLSAGSSESTPIDDNPGREVISILRLANNQEDHLAWTSLLRIRRNRLGPAAMSSIYDLARHSGSTFSQIINQIAADPTLLARFGNVVQSEIRWALNLIDQVRLLDPATPETGLPIEVFITRVVDLIIPGNPESTLIKQYLTEVATFTKAQSLDELLVSLQSANLDIEPELAPGAVNVLTMHRAKGLSANAVIVMAAEDEHIPGRQTIEPGLGDERRLLFVSLSRARNILIMTYCESRIGQQRNLGRNPRHPERTLTTFLRNTPMHPQPGPDYITRRG
jgi:DNA helicase-2/ATP-dependent DNA helicase PcrA